MIQQTEAAHRAACPLCRNRTAEQVADIRRTVARDLAGHDGRPPAQALTLDEVLTVLDQRRGDTNR